MGRHHDLDPSLRGILHDYGEAAQSPDFRLFTSLSAAAPAPAICGDGRNGRQPQVLRPWACEPSCGNDASMACSVAPSSLRLS